MKRQPTEWEKIFANDMNDKRLMFNIYKQFIPLNIKKKNSPIKIWAEELSRHFFSQRIHTDGQQAHEKMLNVANHQGNVRDP